MILFDPIIVLKGVPRLGAARRHPPASRLKGGDAPSRRRHLSAQGARLWQGTTWSLDSSLARYALLLFLLLILLIFFFSCRQAVEALIYIFFGPKRRRFGPFYFKRNRPK